MSVTNDELNPEEIEDMFNEVLRQNLSESTRAFVDSLYEYFDKHSTLTEKQLASLRRLL